VFEGLTAWFERRRALRELRAIEGRNSQAFSMFFTDQTDLAREAYHRGDRDQAYEIWRAMHVRFPGLSMASEKGLDLLVDLGRHDEAEALVRDAQRRHPWHGALYARVLARIAHERGDLEEALRRCGILRRKHPRVAESYTIAAACLAALDRHEEAEAIIARGVRKLPGDFTVLVEHARHAERRHDWNGALLRWGAVRNRHDHILWRNGMTQSLRELQRYAEAEALATETCERFPSDPWAYAELAVIAVAKGDLDEAAGRWALTRGRCPYFGLAYTAGVELARRSGRETEADDILAVAVTRMRYDLGLHLDFARSAQQRGDWANAATRWALVRERFPECGEAREQEANALAVLGQRDKAANVTNDQPSVR
jgi:tetratricopeptide (TPR) repeat protein